MHAVYGQTTQSFAGVETALARLHPLLGLSNPLIQAISIPAAFEVMIPLLVGATTDSVRLYPQPEVSIRSAQADTILVGFGSTTK